MARPLSTRLRLGPVAFLLARPVNTMLAIQGYPFYDIRISTRGNTREEEAMSLFIRDASVDELAKRVQKISKAPNKTEAVRRALQNELARIEETVPLKERVKKIQDEAAAILGPDRKPFDMKNYTDEMYEDD